MVPKVSWMAWLILLLTRPLAGQVGFVENRGQWKEPFQYKADLAPGVSIFVDTDALTFNLIDYQHSHEDNKDSETGKTDYEQLHGHAFRIVFKGAHLTRIIPQDPLPGYENYFLGANPKHWAGGEKKYQQLWIREVWPGIDLKIKTEAGRLKYELHLAEGNDIQKIRLLYEGLDRLTLQEGELCLATRLGEIRERRPVAWTEKGDNLEAKYQLKGKEVSFEVDPKTSPESIVIDPELVFSTYSGSTADNWGFCGTYAPGNAVYSGGIVFNTGYPVSIGAWQQNFAGMCDVGIIKYDSTGTQRLWATYLGGQYADLPHSLIVNEVGELVILGTTGSPNFPVTPEAFDTTFNGGTPLNYASLNFPQGSDIFVAVLSDDGTQLRGSTFVGGNKNDGLNFRQRYSSFMMAGNDSLYYNYGDGARGEVITGSGNEIIAGSCTFSTDFPVTPDAPQLASGGKQEGVLFKLDRHAQHLLYSTYLGGNGDDAIYSVATDSEGNIFFAGGTNSSNLPVPAGAWLSTRPGGGADAFAGRISPPGNPISGLTYFGSSLYDQAYFIKTGSDGFPYIFGQTRASGNTLMLNSTYGQPNSGQFLAKFNPGFTQLLWSTVFGTGDGKPNISPTAFMVDVCGRIYISGWGRIFGNSIINGTPYPWGAVFGTVGLPITPDAIQSQTDGQDFYVAVFSPNATGLEYATFYGELHYPGCSYSGHDHVDGGTSRFDPQGNIIQSVCASCGGCQQFPTSPNPGAWSNSNNSWNCNNAVFKINLRNDFALAGFQQPPSGCAPHTVQFHNTGRGTQFSWDFGDPVSGPANTSNLANPTHTFQQPGLYQITQVVCLPGSCNGCDTVVRLLHVLADTTIRLDTLLICQGEWVQAGISPSPDTSVSYQWIPATGLSASNIPNPWAAPQNTTDYICLVSHPGCTDTLLQRIEVTPLAAQAGNDTAVCLNLFQLIGTSGTAGATFVWSTSATFQDTLNANPSDSTAWIDLLQYGSHTFFLKVNAHPCTAMDSIHLTYAGTVIEAGRDRRICHGDTVHLEAQNLFPLNPVSWAWEPSDFIQGNNQQAAIVALPDSSVWFRVTGTTPWGCTATDSLKVEVSRINPGAGSLNCTCHDLCNGAAWVAPSGGFPPYTVIFSNGAGGNGIQQLCPGTYQAFITDSLGCDTMVVFNITAPSSFLIEPTIVEPMCHGDSTGSISLAISGATPPYSVVWSNGSTGNLLTGIPSGTYIAFVSDSQDCDTTLVFHLHEPLPYQINTQMQSPTCYGQNTGSIHLEISGATPPYVVVWNNGALGFSLNNLSAGSYSALITDSVGCDTVVNFLLTEPPPLQTQAQMTPPLCYASNDGSIQVSVMGGTPPYSLLWSTGDTGTYLHSIPAGNYLLHIKDAHQCEKDTSYLLVSPPPFNLLAHIHHVTCKGWGDGFVQVQTSGASPPYNYLWSNGSTSPAIYNLSGGVYTLTLQDSHQCDTTVTFTLLEATEELRASLITKPPTCFGYNDGEIIASIKGGIPPYSISWQNGLTGDTLSGIPAGVYTAQIYDFTGCQLWLTDTLVEPDSIHIEAQVVPQRCHGGAADGSIHLTISGGVSPYTVLWDNHMTGPDIENLAAGIYQALVRDFKGCEKNYAIVVESPLPISTQITAAEASCSDRADGSLSLSLSGGTGPYTLIWQDGSTDNPRQSLLPGNYPFTVMDASGCNLRDTAYVPGPLPLTASKIVSPPDCENLNNATLQIEPAGGTPPYNIRWEDGNLSFFRLWLSPAVYRFVLSDSRQCQVADTAEIKPPDCNLFIPNVITPNGDGVNDRFIILGIEKFPNNQLIIFNRWGRELLQFKGYKNEWDGRDSQGDLVAEGVYYFILRLSNGREFQGSVTVIR
ncbi:MAG: gliding motility-associated C-terminal domain-containing protein [Bacteroidales bacterium]